MPTFYVNGKFAAQATTGVQRFASQLLAAVDGQLASAPARQRWVLLHPRGAPVQRLARIECRAVGPAGLPLHLWEQAVLPLIARDGTLINLSGSAPLVLGGQICTFHDAAVFDQAGAYTAAFVRWYRLQFRLQARRAARLLTVSAFSRSRLALHLKLDPARIGVVPNGCDHLDAVVAEESILGRQGLRTGRFLLAVGSANPAKNMARLRAAFLSMNRTCGAGDVRLVLVGGRNTAVFAAEAHGVTDPRIVHEGPVTDAELKALYQHAVGLVFPSLYEGFGLPPLEAMACGCPVAVADSAAMPEVCGPAALYFDPLSVDAIAAAMQRLLDDAALRGRLRQAGTVRAASFRWADAARALLTQLPSAASAPRA